MNTMSTGSIGTRKPYISASTVAPTVTKVAAFASCLLAGTGASYPVDTFDSWRQYVQPRVQFPFESKPAIFTDAVLDLRDTAQHLSNVRDVLSPSMSELAKELGVTRQALYKWLSAESQPDSPEKTDHIRRLSIVADMFRANGLSNGKALAKVRAFEGATLLDMVKLSPDWYSQAKIFVSEAIAMKESAKNSGLMSSKSQSSADWSDSESVPGTFGRNYLG